MSVSTYVGVKLFSRQSGEQQSSKIARFDRTTRKYTEVPCPHIIREYNAHMGGVDLMDGLMGRYHIRAKSMNVITRNFYHFINMVCTNAIILHRRIKTEKKNDSSSTDDLNFLELADFRSSIARGLVSKMLFEKRVGRPMTTAAEGRSSPILGTTGRRVVHPPENESFDGFDHLPLWLGKSDAKKKCNHCKKSQTKCH